MAQSRPEHVDRFPTICASQLPAPEDVLRHSLSIRRIFLAYIPARSSAPVVGQEYPPPCEEAAIQVPQHALLTSPVTPSYEKDRPACCLFDSSLIVHSRIRRAPALKCGYPSRGIRVIQTNPWCFNPNGGQAVAKTIQKWRDVKPS